MPPFIGPPARPGRDRTALRALQDRRDEFWDHQTHALRTMTAILPLELHPTTEPAAPNAADLFLWHHACAVADRPTELVPGYTEIHERYHAPETDEQCHDRFAFRIVPDALGRALVSSVPRTPALVPPGRLPGLARPLLDQLEDALRDAYPLRSAVPLPLRRLARTALRSHRCTVFVVERTVAGFAFEFRIWVDCSAGFARRIDFHAHSARPGAGEIAITSANGVLRYRTDPLDRWFQSETQLRLSFWSPALELPPRGTAARTTLCSGHWQPDRGG